MLKNECNGLGKSLHSLSGIIAMTWVNDCDHFPKSLQWFSGSEEKTGIKLGIGVIYLKKRVS